MCCIDKQKKGGGKREREEKKRERDCLWGRSQRQISRICLIKLEAVELYKGSHWLREVCILHQAAAPRAPLKSDLKSDTTLYLTSSLWTWTTPLQTGVGFKANHASTNKERKTPSEVGGEWGTPHVGFRRSLGQSLHPGPGRADPSHPHPQTWGQMWIFLSSMVSPPCTDSAPAFSPW